MKFFNLLASLLLIMSANFAFADSLTYTLKRTDCARFTEFNIMTAVGLLPLGRSLQERGLNNYGIPVCNLN